MHALVDAGAAGVVGEEFLEGFGFEDGRELGHFEFVDGAGGGGGEVWAEDVVEEFGEEVGVGRCSWLVCLDGGCVLRHASIFGGGWVGRKG